MLGGICFGIGLCLMVVCALSPVIIGENRDELDS